MILSLNKCDICADVELVLVQRHKLEQHVLLLNESELILFFELLILSLINSQTQRLLLLYIVLLVLIFGPLNLWLVFLVRKLRIDVVLLVNIFAYLHVLVAF